MFSIAVCDDEKIICSQIEKIILDYALKNNEKIDVQVFNSGEELCRFFEMGQTVDVIFLDIEMSMVNGIEAGRKIREGLDNQTVQIVYISGKDQYYRELFDVRPMHFLHKPIEEAELIKDLRLAMKLADKLGGVFIYKKGYETCRKPVKDILYFASSNREVTMVTEEGEEVFYGKLDEVYEQVAKYHFLYIHKSYIVNYFYVTKFKYEEVTMTNLKVLPISQSKRKAIRELQIEFTKEGIL